MKQAYKGQNRLNSVEILEIRYLRLIVYVLIYVDSDSYQCTYNEVNFKHMLVQPLTIDKRLIQITLILLFFQHCFMKVLLENVCMILLHN